MKTLKILFLSAIFFFPLLSQAATDSCFYYFYGDGCPHCTETSPIIDSLEKKYPNIQVHRYEVWQNKDNAAILDQFFEDYNISRGGVPALFFGDKYYMGSTPIIDSMESEITKGPSHPCLDIASLLVDSELASDSGSKPEPELYELSDDAIIDLEEPSDNWEELGTTVVPEQKEKSDNIIIYITGSIVLIGLIWLGFRKK